MAFHRNALQTTFATASNVGLRVQATAGKITSVVPVGEARNVL